MTVRELVAELARCSNGDARVEVIVRSGWRYPTLIASDGEMRVEDGAVVRIAILMPAEPECAEGSDD